MPENADRSDGHLGADVYSVSRLTTEARHVLEGAFPLRWVEGELSNVARPRSGHLYFTLKDSDAQIRCAMFRQHARHLRFRPTEGGQALVRARVSLYPPRGDFQLIVEHMEESGDGALRRAFEELRQRLTAEGLFATERKRSLPRMPRRLGVITSPTGAALRDILQVLQRRFPGLAVLIHPVVVQGAHAAPQLAEAIRRADRRGDVDVLLIARGGGSLEDLWAFNDAAVARAIAACETPTVSAVGHETDITMADFAADLRAPTPSAGAEALSPDRSAYHQQLASLSARHNNAIRTRLVTARRALGALHARLVAQHPGRRLNEHGQRLDELDVRLRRAVARIVAARRDALAQLVSRLRRVDPRITIPEHQRRVEALTARLNHSMRNTLHRERDRITGLSRALDAVSPLATIGRGYAIVCSSRDSELIKSHEQLAPGSRVRARVADGELTCLVEEARPGDAASILPHRVGDPEQ